MNQTIELDVTPVLEASTFFLIISVLLCDAIINMREIRGQNDKVVNDYNNKILPTPVITS